MFKLPSNLRKVHYTELGPVAPNAGLAAELTCYLRELPRLLAEGLEGQFVLIRGDAIIGFFPTFREAYQAGQQQFGPGPVFAHCILEWEPVCLVRGVA